MAICKRWRKLSVDGTLDDSDIHHNRNAFIEFTVVYRNEDNDTLISSDTLQQHAFKLYWVEIFNNT
jgi:hypothetical protein